MRRHHLRRRRGRDRDTAQGVASRKWRLKCRAVADSFEEAGDRPFTFTRLDPTQWKSARTTNAMERLNEEFRRRIRTRAVLPCAETGPMPLRALLASGRIRMRCVDGWETLSRPRDPMPLDLAARETEPSHPPKLGAKEFPQLSRHDLH